MYSLDRVHLDMIFNYLNKDGDGFVTIDELQKLLDGIKIFTSRDELELLIGRESMNYVDFVLFYDTMIEGGAFGQVSRELDRQGESRRERDFREAFKVFDSDDDRFISCVDLEIALARLGLWDEYCCGKDCKPMIDVYNANSDGLLDFEEFKSMICCRQNNFKD